MNFFQALRPTVTVSDDVQVIFVADFFVEDYVGGAELTSEALIKSSPYVVQKIHARDVTKELVEQNSKKTWIFGNMTSLNPAIVPIVITNCDYVVLEYDYKFCAHRSIEKHLTVEKKECDCETKPIGKLISAFFSHAKCICWMSEQQQAIYRKRFPVLEDTTQFVLSSVFDEEFFTMIKELREKHKDFDRTEWLVQSSDSWIKGTQTGIEYCEQNNLPYKKVSNLSHSQLLEELAKAKGFVFLPPGGDTCPRIVIEAKLLGCDLVLNDNVQHANETWFNTGELDEIEDYLYTARELFWNFVKYSIIEKIPTLSGYTTTLNCISQNYPFEQSIGSMLEFCDEVVVVDGGSSDGTYEQLLSLAEKNPALKVQMVRRNWNDDPRFAVFDGLQKAEARKLCTGDFCWQMDSDEIVHENDYDKITQLMEKFPKGTNLIALPVIEYWGGPEKVRLDVTPWKWRMSRNIPSITHGIPTAFRKIDENGQMYALPGTDGCDMIDSRTGEAIPFMGFYSDEANQARAAALEGNEQALEAYQGWFKQVVEGIPGVHHFSWFDLERKIKTYKNYWGKHWQSLYDQSRDDTAENNMFFDVPWSDVTDEMISDLAVRLRNDCGGWIWHRKWTGKNTPSMKPTTSLPESMLGFFNGRKR